MFGFVFYRYTIIPLLILALLIYLATSLSGGLHSFQQPTEQPANQSYHIVPAQAEKPNNALQLQTLTVHASSNKTSQNQ